MAEAGPVASILQPLMAAAGAQHVRPADPTADAIDGVVPRLVVAPPDEASLARVLAHCHRHRLAVAPRGGGTQLSLGGMPERLDILLDVGGLARIVHYEPADLTVTVQAGMRLGDLQAELGRHGQFLPVDPPAGDGATIGGLLATAASGPLRTGFGHLRDRLLGMRVVRADGRVVRSGGRVVKNVAGYDMGRLHTGALGTLGVIVEATFKVQPRPPAWGAVRVQLDASGEGAGMAPSGASAAPAAGAPPLDADLLEALLAALLDAPAQPVMLEVLGPPAQLLVGFAGTQGEVAFAVQQACRMAAAVADASGARARTAAAVKAEPVPWPKAHGQALAAHRGSLPSLTVRLHGPSDRVAAVIAQVGADAAAAGVPWAYAAHAAAGVVRVHLGQGPAETHQSLIQRWLALCGQWGGNLVVEAAPAALKPSLPVWGQPPSTLLLMRAVKDKFDPHRILNPGRFVGGI